MDETTNLELTPKQIAGDQIAVTVLGALAGLAASKAVERIYKVGMTAYRLKKATA